MEALGIDKATYNTLIQDLFLLPKLPDQNHDKPFKTALPKLLAYALESYESFSPENCKPPLRQCRQAMSNFIEIRSKDTHRVDEEKLLNLIKKEGAAPIPLYLEHHNAAVIIRWGHQHRRIEGFQLSPRADAVTSTAGRLRRTFPEISAEIRKDTAAEPGFMQVLAESLAQMDTSEVEDARPIISVKKKDVEDKFDALLPNHLFDPFFGFLFTETADDRNTTVATTIVKQTRDFAQYVENENKVIRRSPIWLLLKVVLQQELMRKKSSEDENPKEKTPQPNTPKHKTPKEETTTDNTLYKQLMLYFFSLLLDVACSMDFDSQTLHCMARKIGYRTQKLRHALSNSWLTHVEKAVKTANGLIAKRWQEIVQSEQENRASEIPKFQSDGINCYVQHKALDEFLNKVRHRAPQGEVAVPDPKSDFISWEENKLPNVKQLSKESRHSHVFNLIKIEKWVDKNLAAFVANSKDSESSCSDLKTFAIEYFKFASAIYKGYAEHLSVMYLVLLELWVACDQIAVHRNRLLDRYAPWGVDKINFDQLMLRTRNEMTRLSKAEIYIQGRTKLRRSIIGTFGTASCLSSEFVQASKPHQMLKEALERDMKEEKRRKLKELEEMKEQQRKLFEAHKNGECEPSKCRVISSEILCERCNCFAVASEMTIAPCEESLPGNPDLANAIIFELLLPPDISAWRDLSFFLLMDVAGHINKEPQPIGDTYLQNYQPFQTYLQENNLETKKRICLASKSANTRKGSIAVKQDLEPSEICVSHPRKWKLFDTGELKYINEILPGFLIQQSCELTLDDDGSVLQKVLCASDGGIDNPTSQNELIALRLEAENTSILKHIEELGSLCFGNNVTWPKILRELRGTSVDWAAPETFLIITQVALQASPRKKKKGSLSRQRHVYLYYNEFSSRFLVEIRRLLKLYTASFSGRSALAVFCTIIHKILSAGPNDCRKDAFIILNIIRNTCFEWLTEARIAGQDLTSDKFEIQFDLALICAYTFSVDYNDLEALLSFDAFAEQYVFASSIIQECKSTITTQFQASLYMTWQRLAVNASEILVEHVQKGKVLAVARGLCHSFGRDMQLMPDQDHFSHVSGPWVKTSTWALDQSSSKVIHLNLTSGEILIDGKSPAYLSTEYLQHADFRAVFGDMNPAVTSVDDAIYQYQFRHTFKGFTIQVGIDSLKSEDNQETPVSVLHVSAAMGDTVYVLVPAHILSQPRFPFPEEYINNFFHWHNIAADDYIVDLYSRATPWDNESVGWHLEQCPDGWMLQQHGMGHVMMPVTALHYTKLFEIFEHFLSRDDLRVAVNREKGLLEICLGTLGLNFYVESGSAKIHSVEHENMYVDHDYSFKALIGLGPKLVLRNRNGDSKRILLLADGEESSFLTGGHTEIQIRINEHTIVQNYTINESLRQLKGNNSWRSLAWLAYLSALTSHCAPDHFTRSTGQETALDILNSSAMVSFDHLEPLDYALLEKISLLCPEVQLKRRAGANLQTVKWNSKLTPELHHEGFWFSTRKIFERTERLNVLRSGSATERKKSTDAEAKLREAQRIRLACFRAAAYGSHSTSHDAEYFFRIPATKSKKNNDTKSIDYASSASFRRAYRAALGAKNQMRYKNKLPSADDIMSHMASRDALKGETPHYDVKNFRYTAGWRNPQTCNLAQDFSAIHKAIIMSTTELNPYRLRLWLSTVASGMDEDQATNLIPILYAIIGHGSKPSFQIPTTSSTNKSLGTEYSADMMVKRLGSAKLTFNELSVATESDIEKAKEAFIKKQDKYMAKIAQQMVQDGVQSLARASPYVDVQQARYLAKELIKSWKINQIWQKYCQDLLSMMSSLTYGTCDLPVVVLATPKTAPEHTSGHVALKTLMEKSPNSFSPNNEWRTEYISKIKQCLQEVEFETQPALLSMPAALRAIATKHHEKDYIEMLDSSIRALQYRQSTKKSIIEPSAIEVATRRYKADIKMRLDARLQEAESAIWRDFSANSTLHNILLYSDTIPRVSTKVFLTLLSFSNRDGVSEEWRLLLKQIADLYRDQQHMNRILRAIENESHLLNELETLDRNSYDSEVFPDAVLLEIEQDLTLRQNQMDIAQSMRDPPKKSNSVMQLNMGEGKSSVIIPILSASLADGKMLPRVFVGRHQFKQMMDTLSAAFGGLINRPVFCLPFNRESNPSIKDINKIKDTMKACKDSGGVVLLQPEHGLSLLLSTWLNEDTARTKAYVDLLRYHHNVCRDIIDESDELLSPMYELLYTIGTPGPVDFAPDRWILIQGLLKLLADCANPAKSITGAKDVIYEENSDRPDAYPRIRFVTSASIDEVLAKIAYQCINYGIPGFPLHRCSDLTKDAMRQYITIQSPEHKTMIMIRKLGTTVKAGLSLLRGCIIGDILRVALMRKRWRVDYGCDFERAPATRLAVPFAAKDVPKARAEFSNTDIVIIFTHLSYYNSGLREKDARDLIEHMRSSDDGHQVYPQWFNGQSRMPETERRLEAVNLEDEKQFQDKVFPNIRYSFKAINHFLSRLVFPTELGAFSQHISASGWDLGAKTSHPTTGFSGTTDLCALLPLDVAHHDLPTQKHTNALVLNNILDNRNTVLSMNMALSQASVDGTDLVDHVIKSGQVRVIIDVGAQVIRLNNEQVAERWLDTTKDENIKAAVFFDDSGVLSVIDRNNMVMPLNTSVFAKNLDACAVFLDEAHTRGTDLRLPTEYKAAVTLGPGLTKDRLVQACMRMRNLGRGQTLVFYVGNEVERDIQNRFSISPSEPLTIDIIIQWSISQTWNSLAQQMPYWAKQGLQHRRHSEEMNKVFKMKPAAINYEGIEDRFIQKGSNSLWKSYAPQQPKTSAPSVVQNAVQDGTDEQLDGSFCSRNFAFIEELQARWKPFGGNETANKGYDETCEREVAPEVEDEKQLSKPPRPTAAVPSKNEDLKYFIENGRIINTKNGFEKAFESLKRTTLVDTLAMTEVLGNVLVTRDFAMPLDTQNPTDSYQQHVTYVLHRRKHSVGDKDEQQVVIISQSDFDEYCDDISISKNVSLHLYNAKVTPEVARRTDHLHLQQRSVSYSDFYTTATRLALDTFAGQLYFASYEDYMQVSSFLGLAYFDETEEIRIEPDGFIPPQERHKIPEWHRSPNHLWDTFTTSPVPFLKQFLTVVRNHGAGVEHTHMGKILDGERLGENEFPNMRPRTREVMEAEAAEAAEVAEAIEAVEAMKASEAVEGPETELTQEGMGRKDEKRKRRLKAMEEDEEPDLLKLRADERPPKRVKTALTPAARAAMARETVSKKRVAAVAAASSMAAHANCPNAGSGKLPSPPKLVAAAPTSQPIAQSERPARPAKRTGTHENRPGPGGSRPSKVAKNTAGASTSSTASYPHLPQAESSKAAKPPKTKSKMSKSTSAEAKKLLKLWKANSNNPKGE